MRLALSAIVPAFLAFVLYAAPASAQAPSEGAPAPTTPAAEPSDATDPAAVPVAPSAPPEYDLPQPSTRWNLLFTGLAVTGVSYGLALGASYIWPDGRTSEELRVPIVGPWMAIADTGCPEGESDCSTVLLVVGAIFTGVDGVLQAGGLGIALESAFIPTSSGAKREKRAASDALRVRPVPYVAGRDGVGLGVAGTF